MNLFQSKRQKGQVKRFYIVYFVEKNLSVVYLIITVLFFNR